MHTEGGCYFGGRKIQQVTEARCCKKGRRALSKDCRCLPKKDKEVLDSLRGLAPLALHHHSPDQSRLDPQLVQGFHFEGIEVGGLALDAHDSSPSCPHTASPSRSSL